MKKLLFLLSALLGMSQPASSIIGCANENLTQPVENQRLAVSSTVWETDYSASNYSFFKKKNRLANHFFSFKKWIPKNAGKPLTAEDMAHLSAIFGLTGMLFVLLTVVTQSGAIAVATAVFFLCGLIFGIAAISNGAKNRKTAIFGLLPGGLILILGLVAAGFAWLFGGD